MAPAARVELFAQTVQPLLEAGRVGRYRQWHLSEPLEQRDRSTRPILMYGRSLLYLVSESFEDSRSARLLGLQEHYDQMAKTGDMRAWASTGDETQSTTHGDFDDDPVTRGSIIRQILGR
jgi:hypothetical protein